MTEHKSDTGFSPLAQVEAYWEALRGTRQMPRRAEIDPRGIENALEYAFIVERIAPGIARLRIAGSHLSDLMGMEVRGMPLTSFINSASRRQISDVLEEVFETPATCTIHLKAEAAPGMPALEARLLLMPLKSDLGDVSRVLGALVAVGEIGNCPRRFDVSGIALRPITVGTATPMPVKRPVEKAPEKTAAPVDFPPMLKPEALVPGFAEAQPGFRTETPRAHAPYLRVVKSDD